MKLNEKIGQTFYNIKYRCNNKKDRKFKYYGGRGIKCLITKEELLSLWIRDNASSMKRPSIDRIDNNGNYEVSNCRFIEVSENIKKSHETRSPRFLSRKQLVEM